MRDGLCLIPAYAPLFADRPPHPMSSRAQATAAKAVCKRCPVEDTCREKALEEEGTNGASHRFGVRGALTARERAELAGADTADGDGAA
jgi:hypothetical protein